MPFSGPKILLHIEGLLVLTVAGFAYARLGAKWSTVAILFFAPDLSMLGYLFGSKVGAIAYNCLHTYVGPFSLGVTAYFAQTPALLPLAVIWIAHIGLDRMLGYGLKYGTGFKATHLHRV